MIEKITCVNSEILKWARVEAGYSLEHMQKKYNKKIILWESGKEYPTYNQLKELSTYYQKPVALFFFPNPPIIPNIQSSFRTLPYGIRNSFSPSVIKQLNIAKSMQINLFELYDGINPSKNKISTIRFDNMSISEKAYKLRGIFNIDLLKQKKTNYVNALFELWRDAFFQVGIFIFKSAFKDDSVSGFCLYDKEFPVIYVNNTLAHTRQIFTIFHELYHLIQHNSGVDFVDDKFWNEYEDKTNKEIEFECNDFASEFLVPMNDFLQLISGKTINDNSISNWSSQYGVSRQVIILKLHLMGKISYSEYIQKKNDYFDDYMRYKESDKRPTGGNYYATQISYKGKHYIDKAFSKYTSGNINLTQLSSYLNMKIPNVKRLASNRGWSQI